MKKFLNIPVRVTPFGFLAALYFHAAIFCLPALWLCRFDLSTGNYVAALKLLLATMIFFWVCERLLCPKEEP